MATYHTTESFLQLRASRGLVKDYSPAFQSTNTKVQDQPFDYNILGEMVDNDPVLSTAIDLTVDLITYNGYGFIGKNKSLVKDAMVYFEHKLDFDQVIDNILYQMLIYGDAFLELRDLNPVSPEIHALETTEMHIAYDQHGEILGYEQRPNYRSHDGAVLFSPDQIIYFRMKRIGSSVFSQTPLRSIAKSYSTRVYANNFLKSLFVNLPPKLLFFLENSNKKQRESFMRNLRIAKTNPNVDLVNSGKATFNKIQPEFDQGLMEVLQYLRNEVLTITRVPPVWVGITNGANRSTAEAEIIPYETKIKKIQKKVSSLINRELMSKIGFKNLTFRWNPISLRDEKVIVEIARNMKDMGIVSEKDSDEHAVISWMRSKGINLPIGATINDEISNKSIDLMPSRERNNQTTKLESKVDSSGVSEAGTKKLEKKQEK